MNRLTPRLRRAFASLGVLAALVLLATGATACNVNWSPYAAKVGSTVITPHQLNIALDKASANASLVCLLQKSGQTKLHGAGTDTYDTTFSAFVLDNLISARVAADAARNAHIAVPASAYSLAKTQVEDAFGSELTNSSCPGSATEMLNGLDPMMRAAFVNLLAYEDAIAAHAAHVSLTTAGINEYETTHPATAREACLAAVAVPQKATAEGIERRLRHGTSFSSLINQYDKNSSLIPANGVVGCATPSQLASNPTLAQAVDQTPTGKYTAVVPIQGQFLVLQVVSRPYIAPSAALQAILSAEGTVTKALLSAAERREVIHVDPRYGRWHLSLSGGTSGPALSGEVVPPKGPNDAYLLNPHAVNAQPAPSTSTAPIPGQGSPQG